MTVTALKYKKINNGTVSTKVNGDIFDHPGIKSIAGKSLFRSAYYNLEGTASLTFDDLETITSDAKECFLGVIAGRMISGFYGQSLTVDLISFPKLKSCLAPGAFDSLATGYATNVKKIDFPQLTDVIGQASTHQTSVFYRSFSYLKNSPKVSFPLVKTLGDNAFGQTFYISTFGDITFPSVTSLDDGQYQFSSSFYNSTINGVVSFPALQKLGTGSAINKAREQFEGAFNRGIINGVVSFPMLEEISSNGVFMQCFENATINGEFQLPVFKTINGSYGNQFKSAFSACTIKNDIVFPAFAEILSGPNAFESSFENSTVPNIWFSKLTVIHDISVFKWAFRNCTNLQNIYFGKFDSKTLNNLLQYPASDETSGIFYQAFDGCTNFVGAHFPASLRSQLNTLTKGLGLPATQIIFDLNDAGEVMTEVNPDLGGATGGDGGGVDVEVPEPVVPGGEVVI